MITGVFFRNDFQSALLILKHIALDIRPILADLRSAYQTEMMLSMLVGTLLIATAAFNKELKFKYNSLYISGMLTLIFMFGVDGQNQFIYFQF